MSSLLLRQIRCGWCDFVFYVCRCCWKGQAYCCDECRLAGKRKNHREAQRRYRQTPKGKKAHREAENRRRHGLSKKNQKNMDDTSTTGLPAWCMELLWRVWSHFFYLEKSPHCHFCGRSGEIVDEFPRRGYRKAKKIIGVWYDKEKNSHFQPG